MISTTPAGDRRLSLSQRDALGKFVTHPFPEVPVRDRQVDAPGRVRAHAHSVDPLPIKPGWLGWR